jgi:hypothetical protein
VVMVRVSRSKAAWIVALSFNSLADACLVRMSENYPRSVVFTLDHDFVVYRRNSRQIIPTLLPDRR